MGDKRRDFIAKGLATFGDAVQKEDFQRFQVFKKETQKKMLEAQRLSEAAVNMNNIAGEVYESIELLLDSCKEQSFNEKPHHLDVRKINNAKTAMQCLLFGYIREFIEDKYALNIPFYLKALCLTFYGNICMQSRILNINQMNTIQYTLSASLHCKPKYLFAQKIYDSKQDGFDQQKFNEKCGIFDYQSIIVAKTNQNHAFCYQLSKGYYDLFLYNARTHAMPQSIGCLLESPILTVPVLYDESCNMSKDLIYHFQNNFEANRKKKLSEVVIKCNQFDDDFIEKIEYPQSALPSSTDKCYIS